MPPKPKLNKSNGKQKPVLQQKSNNATDNNGSGPELSPEALQQFEVELCWCIQQLQFGLKAGKLNAKQIQDHTKALNGLMSNSTPLIKKRQIMRLSFGDYRAKMAEESKKHSSVTARIKVIPSKPSKKSVFLKKSIMNSSGGDFKFNFQVPKTETCVEDDISKDISNIKIEEIPNEDKIENNRIFHFTQTNNNFRFNFNVKS